MRIRADQLGPAPIRALYRWADAHTKAHFSAEIEWMGVHEKHPQILIQQPEFQRLKVAISATSGEHSQVIALRGSLTAANATKRTFQFRTERGEVIRGKSGDVISSVRTVELPKRYKAVVRKTTKIQYSTDREEVLYALISLDPLSTT